MKRFLLVSVIFLSAAVLFAGGSKESTRTSTDGATGTTSITLWTYWDQIPAYETWYAQLAAFQKENPSIALRPQFVSYNQMKDKLTVAAMSSSMPDLMQMDYAWIMSFAKMGALADITDRFASSSVLDKSKYFEAPIKMSSLSNRLYAIPQDANNTAMYYNKDLFAKADLGGPPKNWTELADYAQKLSGGQTYGYCLSLNDPTIAVYEFMPYVWAAGGDFDRLNSPGTIAALTLFKGMVDNGSMSPEVVSMDHDATAQQFMQQRAAMYQEGPWRLIPLEQNATFKWGVAPIVSGPNGQATSLGGEGIGIGAKANVAAAWKFIEFTQAPQRSLALDVGIKGLPIQQGLAEKSELFKNGALSVFAGQMPYTHPMGPNLEMPKVAQAVMTMIQSVIIGKASPKNAAARAAEEVAPYFSAM